VCDSVSGYVVSMLNHSGTRYMITCGTGFYGIREREVHGKVGGISTKHLSNTI
jgi:hypothetical protein